ALTNLNFVSGDGLSCLLLQSNSLQTLFTTGLPPGAKALGDCSQRGEPIAYGKVFIEVGKREIRCQQNSGDGDGGQENCRADGVQTTDEGARDDCPDQAAGIKTRIQKWFDVR